jgi:predicted phosphodiesterase
MRYALISDIHANLPALEAVLRDIAARPEIDATYHLGDLVGYGPWPNETISLLKGFDIPGIQGNHEGLVAQASARDLGLERSARSLSEWTAQRTSAWSIGYLASVPFRMDLRPNGGHVPGPVAVLLHGTLESSSEYSHEDRSDAFLLQMAKIAGARTGDVICCGHTHLPWYRDVGGVHFLNTGSVGRSKDGDWRAGYVILGLGGEQPEVEFVRVEYDLEATMGAIRESELPDDSAEYLRTGGKPTRAEPGATHG